MAPHPNVMIPDPGGYEFYSFGTGFLVYPKHVLSLSAKISSSIEEDFKEFLSILCPVELLYEITVIKAGPTTEYDRRKQIAKGHPSNLMT